MLGGITKLWLSKIKLAADFKQKRFAETADTIERFYNRPHDFIYGGSFRGSRYFLISPSTGGVPQPTFKMTVNKTAEWVGIMLPVIYHRNPYRVVTPRRPNIQFADLGISEPPLDRERELVARLLQWYLNFTPNELDLKTEARFAVKDALIAGRGVLWTEVIQTPSGRMVGSFHESWRHLHLDPDADKLRHAKWAVRERIWPTWQFERHFGLEKGSVKPNLSMESSDRQSVVDAVYPGGTDARKAGKTNDLVRFYEVYSRMGLGGLAAGADPRLREKAESLGHHVYLVVTDVLPYPANLPPSFLDDPDTTDEDIVRRISWPSPHWMDPVHPWPFSCLDFLDDGLWPVAPLAPALGEQIFIDWAYSFMASRVRSTSRTVIAVNQAFQEEVERALADGGDEVFLRLKLRANDRLNDVVNFISHPDMKNDFFAVLQAVERNWDKRTGLTELHYGQTDRQMRSASEAQIRSQAMAIRPDEMSNRVEDFMTNQARSEAIMARTLLSPADVAPVFGERVAPGPDGQIGEESLGPFTKIWAALIGTMDVPSVVTELDYRIESGSARKPNRLLDQETIDNIMPVLMPMLQQYYFGTGDPSVLNAFLRKWADSRGYPNWQDFMMPPLGGMGQGGQQPGGEVPPDGGPGGEPPAGGGAGAPPAAGGAG